MPGKVRRKLGARRYQNYDPVVLQHAVEAVQRGEMSSYLAADVYNIPRRTIENKVKNLHNNKPGRQTVLGSLEEEEILEQMLVCADWGMPIDGIELRLIVKNYLDSKGRVVPQFRNNTPGEDWYRCFIKRHKDKLSSRRCQNISRARASVGINQLKAYFGHLQVSLDGIPSTHILNYDETNLTDDPGSKKMLFRRGCKYPERMINATKASVSLMFASTASGTLLPCYVVYRSKQLWDAWITGGPKGTVYGNTPSGWFDANHFEKWFKTIVVPWAKKLDGPKCLIGDNLSSHVNVSVIEACKQHDIRFVFLPPSSTHLCQPLDVSVFAPCKRKWRAIMTDYKMKNPKSKSLEKGSFPRLLAKLLTSLEEEGKMASNIKAGFRKCGIVPFNPQEVYSRVPHVDDSDTPVRVSDTLLSYLQSCRRNRSQSPVKKRRRRLNVEPGEAVDESHLKDAEQPLPSTSKQKPKKTNKKRADDDSSEDAYSLHDTSSGESEDEPEDVSPPVDDKSDTNGEDVPLKKIDIGMFVVVKFVTKKIVTHFVGKLTRYCGDGEFEISYLRPKNRGSSFYFPDVPDEALVNVEDIVYLIDPPYCEARGRFSFADENVQKYF